MASKTYKFNEDKFWFLVKHPILTELDYKPPRLHPDKWRFEHERYCADLFSVLAASGYLTEDNWFEHKKLPNGFIPDRGAMFDEMYYFEVQLNNMKEVTGKLENYHDHFRRTKENFNVIFLVPEKHLTQVQSLLPQNGRYQVAEISAFLASPFTE